jgi:vacuolar-type H+-ATPase subunit I/STV1
MPSSDLFFNKKRKAVVQGRISKKEKSVVKKYKILFDGQGLNDIELAENLVGSIEAFASANSWSVGNIVQQVKQKDQLIKQLQDQLVQTQASIEEQVKSKTVSIQQQYQQLISEFEEKFKVNSQDLDELKSSLSQKEERIDQLETVPNKLKIN